MKAVLFVSLCTLFLVPAAFAKKKGRTPSSDGAPIMGMPILPSDRCKSAAETKALDQAAQDLSVNKNDCEIFSDNSADMVYHVTVKCEALAVLSYNVTTSRQGFGCVVNTIEKANEHPHPVGLPVPRHPIPMGMPVPQHNDEGNN